MSKDFFVNKGFRKLAIALCYSLFFGLATAGSAGAVNKECTTTGSTEGYAPCPIVSWSDSTLADYHAARSNPGSANTPIDVPNDPADGTSKACRFIDNTTSSSSNQAFFVPFKSANEWKNFLNIYDDNPGSIVLTPCTRAASFTVYPNTTSDLYPKCLAPYSPGSRTVALPYARPESANLTRTTAFSCANGVHFVEGTYTPGESTDGVPTTATSGWSESLSYYNEGCGSADGTGSATAPDTNLCAGSLTADPITPVLDSSTWTWACKDVASSAFVECSAPYSAAPKCGTADGLAVGIAPSSDLCDVGTSSVVSGLGPWTWTCTEDANTESCSAPTNVTASCGSADGTPVETAPTSDLCSGGTASVISGTGPWTWTCDTSETSDNCSAPMAAKCGDADGVAVGTVPSTDLCSSGTASAISGTGPWTWTCTEGGSSDSCSAPKTTTASCGSAAGTVVASAPTTGLCSVGTASTVVYISNASPLAQWYYQWTCTEGPSSVICIAPKCACAMCGPASGVSSETAPSTGLCGYGILRAPPSVFLNTATQWKWYCDDAPTASQHTCYAPKP